MPFALQLMYHLKLRIYRMIFLVLWLETTFTATLRWTVLNWIPPTILRRETLTLSIDPRIESIQFRITSINEFINQVRTCCLVKTCDSVHFDRFMLTESRYRWEFEWQILSWLFDFRDWTALGRVLILRFYYKTLTTLVWNTHVLTSLIWRRSRLELASTSAYTPFSFSFVDFVNWYWTFRLGVRLRNGGRFIWSGWDIIFWAADNNLIHMNTLQSYSSLWLIKTICGSVQFFP